MAGSTSVLCLAVPRALRAGATPSHPGKENRYRSAPTPAPEPLPNFSLLCSAITHIAQCLFSHKILRICFGTFLFPNPKASAPPELRNGRHGSTRSAVWVEFPQRAKVTGRLFPEIRACPSPRGAERIVAPAFRRTYWISSRRGCTSLQSWTRRPPAPVPEYGTWGSAKHYQRCLLPDGAPETTNNHLGTEQWIRKSPDF